MRIANKSSEKTRRKAIKTIGAANEYINQYGYNNFSGAFTLKKIPFFFSKEIQSPGFVLVLLLFAICLDAFSFFCFFITELNPENVD